MSLFTSAKAKLAAQKLAEEQLYEFAAEEIAANNIRPGLWAKAIAEADGEDAKAKARYIKLRVETMKAEADLSSYVHEETAKAAREANSTEVKTEAKPEKGWNESQPADSGSMDDLTLAFILFSLVLLLFVIPLALSNLK